MRGHLEDVCGFDTEEARLRASIAPGSIGSAIALDLDDYETRRDVA